MLSNVAAAVDSPRKVKNKVDPIYPQLAKQLHLAGTVNVSVTITPAGTVRMADVVGGSPVLAQAAVDAVKKWKFEPGPGETKQVIEFRFHE
jgi:protein TonB